MNAPNIRRLPPRERLLAQCERVDSGCWLWTSSLNWGGYGSMTINGQRMVAHRAAYLLFVGEIPAGLDLDHVCHTRDTTCPGGTSCVHRRCVNPDHLEPVTRSENLYRGKNVGKHWSHKTHCAHGHEFTPENTYIRTDRKNGRRQCRTCMSEASRRHRERTRAA